MHEIMKDISDFPKNCEGKVRSYSIFSYNNLPDYVNIVDKAISKAKAMIMIKRLANANLIKLKK